MGLGLPINEINLGTLNTKLNKKKEILQELNNLSSNTDSWYWQLNELRNHSLHRAMLHKNVSMGIFEDVNKRTSKSTKPQVAFLVNPRDVDRQPMNKPVIEYFDESLQMMRDLIDRIRNKAGIII